MWRRIVTVTVSGSGPSDAKAFKTPFDWSSGPIVATDDCGSVSHAASSAAIIAIRSTSDAHAWRPCSATASATLRAVSSTEYHSSDFVSGLRASDTASLRLLFSTRNASALLVPLRSHLAAARVRSGRYDCVRLTGTYSSVASKAELIYSA